MTAVPISTLTFRTNALDSMEALEAAMSKTQQQLSTGKSIQTAADNPAGMAQVNQLNMELSASQQYVTNSHVAGAKGDNPISDHERELARALGRRLADVARRLVATP